MNGLEALSLLLLPLECVVFANVDPPVVVAAFGFPVSVHYLPVIIQYLFILIED